MKIISKALLAGAAVSAATIGSLATVSNCLSNRNSKLYEIMSEKNPIVDMGDFVNIRKEYMTWLEEYGYEKHEIYSDRGQKLQGYLVKSQTKSNKYVFAAHGYRSTAKIEFCLFAHYYTKMGLNVFMVDHQAAGASEGKFIGWGEYESIDGLKWLSYMIDTFGDDIDISLHGVSMGCATVMRMAGSEKLPQNVKFAVADCGFSAALDLFHTQMKSAGVLAKPIISGVNLCNKLIAGVDLDKAAPINVMKNTTLPILFVHGKKDDLVPYQMTEQMYAECATADEDKQLMLVEDAGHAQNIVFAGDQYMAKVQEFIDKYEGTK